MAVFHAVSKTPVLWSAKGLPVFHRDVIIANQKPCIIEPSSAMPNTFRFGNAHDNNRNSNDNDPQNMANVTQSFRH